MVDESGLALETTDIINETPITMGSNEYEMIELFTDVEALILSDILIGTFSSCVGQYINVRRQGRETVSLDSNFYFN